MATSSQLIENSRINARMTLSANLVEMYELPIGILDTKCKGAFTTTGPVIGLCVGVGISTTPTPILPRISICLLVMTEVVVVFKLFNKYCLWRAWP